MILSRSYGASAPGLTKVYATWDPANKYSTVQLSNGNLTFLSADNTGVKSTISVSTGKWYWEQRSGTKTGIGVCTVNTPLSAMYTTESTNYFSTGVIYRNGSLVANVVTSTTGNIIGVAVDVDARTVQIFKNNVLLGTYAIPPGDIFAGGSYSDSGETNFGATPFTYSPPAGYNSGLYEFQGPPAPPDYHAYLNPLDKSGVVTLSGKNLTAAISSTGLVRANIGKSEGSWYFETKINTAGSFCIGLVTAAAATSASPGSVANSIGLRANGDVYMNGSIFSNFGAIPTGSIIGIKFTVGGSFQPFINGSRLFGLGIGNVGTLFPAVGSFSGATNLTCNFGSTPFTYPQDAPFDVGVI